MRHASPTSPPRTSAEALIAVRDAATCSHLLAETGADPWVLRHHEEYLYCRSVRDRAVVVSRAASLFGIGDNEQVVWAAPDDSALAHEVWAPELHRIQDKWYIYFAAGHGPQHRMYVLEAVTDDPQGEYVLKGKIADAADRWAIDGTVLHIKDTPYFLWSGFGPDGDSRQSLYIAEMANPWTLTGPTGCISEPEYDWEHADVPDHIIPLSAQRDFYAINEGPQALWNGQDLFVIYSASHTMVGTYCLGQLRYTGGDPLSADSWDKHPEPVFCTNDVFESPGHASFTRVGDEDWIVYHTAKRSGSALDRHVLAQPFTWHADGSPNFQSPLALREAVMHHRGANRHPY